MGSIENYKKYYGCHDGLFSSTIHLCCSIFRNYKSKRSSETILYFTNRDSPHNTNSDEYKKSLLRATDLKDNNIEFDVIPINEDFDFEKFYKEFICLAKGDSVDTYEPQKPEAKREFLKNNQLISNPASKCLSHFKWEIGPGIELAVQYYNLYQKSMYLKSVKLLRCNNSVIEAKRVSILTPLDETNKSTDCSRILLPGEEIFFFLNQD